MATPGGRAELLNAIYERIVVIGPELISARLTPGAYAMGLALALPEHVRPAQGVGTDAPDRSRTRAHPLGIQIDFDQGADVGPRLPDGHCARR